MIEISEADAKNLQELDKAFDRAYDYFEKNLPADPELASMILEEAWKRMQEKRKGKKMKVVIELQEAFRSHYEEDKFEDSLRRIYDDVSYYYTKGDSFSGNYELELLEEFKRVFPKSYQSDGKSGKWVRDEFGSRCSCCGLYAYRDKFGEPWESDFCPYCGATMDGKGEEQ